MHYPDLTIRGFRGIKELTLPTLGRVNLLAGKNNTGKSSVLEALQLHAQNGDCRAILVSPGYDDDTHLLGTLWDQVTLTDSEDAVVEFLRIFDPNISDFSMVAGEVRDRRVGMARTKNTDHPVSLRSFGGGMNRMFRIALSLVRAGGGILLVDEFENGLHYSVQPDAWRMVFKLARDLDVQVFATTHSMDTIRSFAQVAISSEDTGVLIRLNRRGDVIMPITYTEEELAIAYRHAIEVR